MEPGLQIPQSIEAERALLGSILLSVAKVLDECLQEGVTGAYFSDAVHRQMFDALIKMRETGLPVDRISLAAFLETSNMPGEVGWENAFEQAFSIFANPGHVSRYIEILRKKYLLRQISLVSEETARRARLGRDDAQSLLEESGARLRALGDDYSEGKVMEIKRLATEALDGLERLFGNRTSLTGLSTGLAGFDGMTNGLQPGEMVVVASRPSMGKTALALNIAEHVAIQRGKAVAIFSLELSAKQLMQRLLCSVARVDLKKIRDGFMTKNEDGRLIQATQVLAESKMFVDDAVDLSVSELRRRSRLLKDRQDIELIVIDHLHLLKSPLVREREGRPNEIGDVVCGIRAMARELNIPVLVLAPLNRGPEHRSRRRRGFPSLCDLRESGAIEEHADVVGLLWREEYYSDDDEERRGTEGHAELIIAKQRNGPVGGVPLTFLKSITRFEDRAPERDEPPR